MSDSSGRHSTHTVFHVFDRIGRKSGTARSSRRIMTRVRLGICLSFRHPYLVVLVLRYTAYHAPAISSPDSACGCGWSPRRGFVRPHTLEQYIPPHSSVTFLLVALALTAGPSTSPLHRISRVSPASLSCSGPRCCSVFHIYRCESV